MFTELPAGRIVPSCQVWGCEFEQVLGVGGMVNGKEDCSGRVVLLTA